ncbi:2-oxo acid dehydrogenase subunit E2 [Halorarum halophilum]|uniref:2-oxo acid dehydrogenase subunit E2 n=1 Tax=Halorarum halophilum TaxID=2743090 RepID=A0A7D5GD75_9EURY|nr:2-oxo acid dehydrogenase subunit E2 [Halobaculum halophilum]QLG28786.1 2-oxo acid dehydrogenase subunit E2 [Halobaculum halophilum]
MAERTFELPDLGEGIAEGELVSWLVAPGEHVEEDQTIAEVETDKALVEVPSPYEGTVSELHYEEGEMVPVDSVVVTFDVDGDDGGADSEGTGGSDESRSTTGDGAETTPSAAGDAETSESGPSGGDEQAVPQSRVFAAPTTRTLARELGVDLAAVVGSDGGGRVTEADVREAADAGDSDGGIEGVDSAGESVDASASDSGGASTSAGPTDVTGGEPAVTERASADAVPVTVEGDGADRKRTLAMPATRRLAEEAGVDIDDVPASEERDGEAFVTPEDVRAYLESRRSGDGTVGSDTATAVAGSSAGGNGATAGGGNDTTAGGGGGTTAGGATSGERVPYRGVRQTIGEQMARSKYTAPHVSHHDEFDAADLVAVRGELAEVAEREGVKLTYMPFVIRAITTALQEFPYLNSSLDEEAGEIVLHDEYNVGIAVATDAGLMVPVVKNADRKGLKELAADVRDLAERARNREISPSEMQGGTFTVTNIGVIGGEFSSPIINHPEAAIFAMGPIRKRPWVVDDEVVARETMRFSMSVDHRLVDGADAARFSNRVKELLANPALLLLD